MTEIDSTTRRLNAIDSYRRLLKETPAELHHEVERRLARTDLFYLLLVICERTDINKDWLFERCREIDAAPDGYLDLWAREHFKSSIITFGKTIQDILNNPEITVGIFSFNRPIAKAFLRQIKNEFKVRDKLKALFPEILWEDPEKEAPKWNEDEGIIVKRKGNPKESTVEAWGLVDNQPTSKHYDLMIYDDAVVDKSVTTPEMIEKVTAAWSASLNLTRQDGRIRYVGTRWHYNDTYRTILERRAAIERRYPATDDGTFSGRPVLWTSELLAEKVRTMGTTTAAAQLLCDPAADRKQGFLDEWVNYYEDRTDFQGSNKYIIVDPANTKKKKSDYTAMVVIGLGPDGNYYVIDMVRDRLSLRERGDALFSLHRRWRPLGVGYEEYGLQADIEYMEERMTNMNYRFRIIPLGGSMNKPDRIRRTSADWEAGRWYLPESLLKVNYEGIHVDLVQSFLLEEYKPFPVGLHDDVFDAMSRIMDADLGAIWPRSREAEDRYAKPRKTVRRYSPWAA